MANFDIDMKPGEIWSYTLTLIDEAATQAFGQALGETLRPSDVVALTGPLGAGKSTLARAAIAAFAGITDAPSPTFGLAHAYYRSSSFAKNKQDRAHTLYHFDLYRLNHPHEVWELGLEDALDEGVSLIEWPEKIAHFLPSTTLLIEITPMSSPSQQSNADPDCKRTVLLKSTENWTKRLSSILPETF